MDDLQRRAYVAADAPALAELMNAIEEHGGGRPSNTADELNALIKTLVRDPASDSAMLFAPAGALVATAFTTTPPAGGYRVFLTGGVHPAWRGRGIGRELLSWQLERAAQIHAATAPDAAWEVQAPRTPLGDEDTARLFRRFGLRPARYWFEMGLSTAVVPAVDIPEGLRIAPYSDQDELDERVHAAHMESFAGNWGFQRRDVAGWVSITVRSATFAPELSAVAFDGSELAGYVLAYNDPDPGKAYIGQLGIRPPWRRRGLGAALLARAVDLAAAAGRKRVELSVDADSPTGATRLYERVGFAVDHAAATYAKPCG